MSEPTSRLQREIRQTRPFRSRAQEALLALLRTADLVRRHGERAAAAHDLSLQQYNVLRILRGAEPDGLCTLEIAGRMVERAPGITRLLDRLEGAKLVTRRRSSEDRREVRCRISREGLALLAEMDPAMNRLDDEALARLPPADLDRLVALLDRIRDGLDPETATP